MSALIVLVSLLAVFWLALGCPKVRRRCACGNGRSIGWLGSLVSGTIALAVFGRLIEHLFLVELVIAAVGSADVALILVLVLRARR